MPLASTAPQKSQSCLQIIMSQFSLLTTIERLGNEGSLAGINALLVCPLHLPSTKHLDGAKWGNFSGMQKKTVCYSLYYAINWIRELLNAFGTQVESRVDNVSQKARDETAVKLMRRVRNLIDYNCTVEYYRSPFIVLQGRPPAGAPKIVRYTIRVDAMDWMSDRGKWKDADVLIFNTGHWWNNEKTIRGGAYFHVGDEVKIGMTVADAYRRSIQTLSAWLRKEVNTSKTHVIYRTYAPVHFRGGDWKTGGSCHLETLPDVMPVKSLDEWAYLLQPVLTSRLVVAILLISYACIFVPFVKMYK